MNEYEFYDLKKHDCPTWVEEIFYKGLEDIAQSDYQLKYNYTIKELKLDKMASFIIIVDPYKKDLICFSGLQIDSWPYEIGRISSRHYFNKKYTPKYLRKRLNWNICAVEQIKAGLEQGIDRFFFSTELMHERMFRLQCVNSTKAINTILPDVKLIPLDGLYDTTGKRKHWQKIGQIIISNKWWDFPLEKKEE